MTLDQQVKDQSDEIARLSRLLEAVDERCHNAERARSELRERCERYESIIDKLIELT